MIVHATIGKRNKYYRLKLSTGITFLCRDFKVFRNFLKRANSGASRRDGVYVKTVDTLGAA